MKIMFSSNCCFQLRFLIVVTVTCYPVYILCTYCIPFIRPVYILNTPCVHTVYTLYTPCYVGLIDIYNINIDLSSVGALPCLSENVKITKIFPYKVPDYNPPPPPSSPLIIPSILKHPLILEIPAGNEINPYL